MARGKHQRSKAAREQAALRGRVAELEQLLTAERAERVEAEREAARVRELREELSSVLERNGKMLAGYTERLRDELQREQGLTQLVSGHMHEVLDAWHRTGAAVIDYYGGGIEGTERFMHGTGIDGVLTADVAGAPPTTAVQRIQMARRQRTPGRDELTASAGAGSVISGVTRPCLDAADDDAVPASVRRALAERRDRVGATASSSMHPDSVYTWHPLVGLGWDAQDPFVELPAALGGCTAVTQPATAVTAGERIAHHRARSGELWPLAARDAAVAAAAGRLQHPWQPLPRFSRPGDAALLRHQYACAAFGAWMRAAENRPPNECDLADESTWSTPEPSGMTGQLAHAAVAAREAVPFWLPPGQTHGFADSEPLPQADLIDLRMPFAASFLAFAEPLRVPAGRSADQSRPGAARALASSLTALKQQADGGNPVTVMDVLTQLGDRRHDVNYLANPVTAAQLIGQFGAWVEAILFRADDEGVLDDEFGWCLALDAGVDGVVAGRVLVPARRSQCSPAVAAMLLNLAAVPAWGDWHEPADAPLTKGLSPKDIFELAGSTDFDDAEKRGATGQVRILNIARTGGGDPVAPTGRSVAPHLRRGHWRRQHYGAGRLLTRRVRIPAVLVNAGKFIDVAPRVYTVPGFTDATPYMAADARPGVPIR